MKLVEVEGVGEEEISAKKVVRNNKWRKAMPSNLSAQSNPTRSNEQVKPSPASDPNGSAVEKVTETEKPSAAPENDKLSPAPENDKLSPAPEADKLSPAPDNNSSITTPASHVKKEGEEEEEERPEWDNQVQFILTCIGLAVGLGNIWKFPYLAYDNGGSAFLFPYITCAFVFGLPMVYAEFYIGQYARSAPPQAFRAYAPAFQGLGWTMALMSGTVAIYYTTIIAWAGVYMAFIVLGRMGEWTSCDNPWNTENCIRRELNAECFNLSNGTFPFQNMHVQNTFVTASNLTINCWTNSTGMMGASEEFYIHYLTRRSDGLASITGMNWPIAAALIVMWTIVALILIKGIALMGYSAYVTSTLPYLIVAILFVRGVTLENASEGIIYYLGKPDFSKVLQIKTWTSALTQIMFSISIGYGGLITLSSYSKFNNNCFRDSLIVICGDTFMSVFGGVAVFSTIGYLAKLNGKRIEDTVSEGTALAFIVYPEAISTMPLAPVIAMLFFLMLFCLGISSEVALVEVLCTCIYDHFRSTRKRKWAVVLAVCGTYFALAFIMATDAGIHWFNIYNGYCGTTTSCIIAALEIIVVAYFYGRKNALKDCEEMLGPGSKNAFCRAIGHLSPYWGWSWTITCPLLALVIGGFTCNRTRMAYDNGELYPLWAEFVGWFLNLCPLLALPLFFYLNSREFSNEGKPLRELFKTQKELRSYNRIMGVETQTQSEEKKLSNEQKA